MTVEISLAVNDEHGNVTDDCQAIEVLIDGDPVMFLDLDDDVTLAFVEMPDDMLQIGSGIFKYEERATMVGNVFWNQYRIRCAEVIRMLNRLKTDFADCINVWEAESSLRAKWHSGNGYTMDDFNALIANTD